MFNSNFENKYLKYKNKYLSVKQKGGRLLDLTEENLNKKIQSIKQSINFIDLEIKKTSLSEKLDKLQSAKENLKTHLNFLSEINYKDFNKKCKEQDLDSGKSLMKNDDFDYCDNINNNLTSKNNSYLIIFNFIADISVIHPNIYLDNHEKYIQNIIQNSYTKSNNIILITTVPYTLPHTNATSKIEIIKTTNKNALNELNNKINQIIIKNQPSNNITIYNLAHGVMNFYDTNKFIWSGNNNDEKAVSIEIKDYFDKVLKPLYSSFNNFNIMLVNGNCFSSFNIFKKIKKLLLDTKLTGKINLYTYSIRPYIKYFIWLRNFLHFVSFNTKCRFKSALNDNDKFSIFNEAINEVECILTKSGISNNQIESSNRKILLYTLSTEDTREILNEINLMRTIINPITSNNIFKMVNKLVDSKTILQNEINLKEIDLYYEFSSDSFLNKALEQGTLGSTNTYTYHKLLDAFSSINFLNYETDNTIRQLNNKKSELVNWYMTNEIDSGISILRLYGDDNEIKNLLEMSLNEQIDTLFIPIENDTKKRNQMRDIKFKDLL